MRDTSELTAAVERFADRLRAAPQSRLQRGAAAEGLALARELAVRAQRVEDPEREPRTMPDAGVFTVADQLVVAGNDLAEILRTAPADSHGGDLAEAVERVREAAERAGL
ncbi:MULTISPECIES: hypothetical protein [unclassified Streptomyces]|uniref:hypothetical protein n=1 Tax=unclassified Streptomyces TaxID=2593676 RepID=UPI0006F757BE|nr:MULTISPECIES: hypothetical protein [unclassified Streptomyces]KQX57817.1 hypothetical protein ASD33_25235 [Streptomyces sp. Root1304]KRA78701.1 hypothetical protein ASE09_22790 [Streptomyces sp. Root66D1]